MNKFHILLGLLSAIFLSSCSTSTPKCGEKETLELLRELYYEQLAKHGADASVIGLVKEHLNIEFDMVRATSYQKEIDKYSCAANVTIGYSGVAIQADSSLSQKKLTKEISYEVQRLEDGNGQFFISALGFDELVMAVANEETKQRLKDLAYTIKYHRAVEKEQHELEAKFAKASVTGKVNCDDFNSTQMSVQYMEKIAELAKLSDGYYSKYHEGAVRSLCKGDVEDVHSLVDRGDVTNAEAVSIANVLDKSFHPRERTKDGIKLEQTLSKLTDLGLCTACAGNAANAYVYNPETACAEFVGKALKGDKDSIEILQTDEDVCSQ